MSEQADGSQQDICALCREPARLHMSHILPAFVFRWLRETSATGHIRSIQDVNRRVQDGDKKPWLCGKCEAALGRDEREFSTKLFLPFLEGTNTVAYGPWLQRFCVSVSWRVLAHLKGTNPDQRYTDEQEQQATKAEKVWRDYLLGNRESLAGFDQHLLPLDIIEDTTFPDLPENINRFLARNVEMDVIGGRSEFMTYAKLGRFVIFGMMKRPRQAWGGTRVFGNSGQIAPRTYSLPASIMYFLMDRARLSNEAISQMSEKQVDKVDAAILANIDRVVNSEQMRAMVADAAMFGEQAILRKGTASTGPANPDGGRPDS